MTRSRGGTSAWGVFAAIVFAAALLLVLLLASESPEVSGVAIMAIMGVLLAGSAWWQCLEGVRTLRRRARLTIAHLLSDGRPRDREEIARELFRRVALLRFPPLRWLKFEERALEDMTRRGVLILSGGRYSAAKHAERDVLLAERMTEETE